MKIKNAVNKYVIGLMGLALMLCFTAISLPAQDAKSAKEIRKQQKEGRDEVRESTKVFREIMNVPEKAIPRELLEKAEAIGVFPNVRKAGFIVGGRGGDGVVARKMKNGTGARQCFTTSAARVSERRSARKIPIILCYL